jgi:hypothetical protein
MSRWVGVVATIAVALGITAASGVRAQRQERAAPTSRDLTGIWTNGTTTLLERPAAFANRSAFTPAEAKEFERTFLDRVRSLLPAGDAGQQSDLNETYVDLMPIDRLRTSLVVDPPDGRLPPLLPAAQARAAARPKRSYDNPETVNLYERCLLGNSPAGGSVASPPIIPAIVVAPYYQIVQTDRAVLIFTEHVHDARVIRLDGVHPPPQIRQWLGDSIGHWEGSTLVVDVTNFREDTHNQGSGLRLHVVERWTRTAPGTIIYRAKVEDPDTWASPWTEEVRFTTTNVQLFEFACHEGNYAIENYLRGARADEQRIGDDATKK